MNIAYETKQFFSLKHLTQELNNEQLGWFTRPQAQAVTAEQKGLLTNQGKEALEGAVTPVAGEGNTKQRNNKPTKTSGYQSYVLCSRNDNDTNKFSRSIFS